MSANFFCLPAGMLVFPAVAFFAPAESRTLQEFGVCCVVGWGSATRGMDRYVCIHGHFYQPPRENPWLESVEVQDSAAPWHDWNARIAAECYTPNATARILDGQNRIIDIVNNYSKISFNFGPTLLAWMKEKLPDLHAAVVAADQQSRQNYSGHGSALAQVYNHTILPLGNERDKRTQVLWGIRDFQSRFGREPEGMWLAETAADTPALETLAQYGINFTILSPFQAARTRKKGAGGHWKDVNGGRIDPTRPYLMRLPSGRRINIFFFDAPVSRAVAFERLLESGDRLAGRLLGAISDKRAWPQLVHIATDGESYGHHHGHGEMALAYALRHIESSGIATLTNYGEFLAKHPPTHEVQIHEGSAWSCSHGVGRWKENCGCNSGGHGDWNQNWRAPLRHALDWLRDELAPKFEVRGAELLKDPWAARDDYIYVILDRSPNVRQEFFQKHARQPLEASDHVTILQLMELQRHAMLMYTSCGWFFDELSGIETVQVIQYAARAIQLARSVLQVDLEPGFLDRLQHARSNIAEHGDGRVIYEKFVRPAMIGWEHVVAHYAISSLFHKYGTSTKIFLYSFEEQERIFATAGKAKLAIGRAKVEFDITHESEVLCYAVLYMGEHNLTGAVQRFSDVEAFRAAAAEVQRSFDTGDFPETIRLIDRHFGQSSYSLKSLFKDEQRRIVEQILAATRDDLENRFRLIADRYTPLMKFLSDIGMPLPLPLQTATDFVLHTEVLRLLQHEGVDVDRLRTLVAEAQNRNLLGADFSYTVKNKMEEMIGRFSEDPEKLELLENLEDLARVVVPLPVGLNLSKIQNCYIEMARHVAPRFAGRAATGETSAAKWLEHFLGLGGSLEFSVDHLRNEIEQHAAEERQAA
jgi:alpha-amylase/alpha-mannosidase (GH57 family)